MYYLKVIRKQICQNRISINTDTTVNTDNNDNKILT